MKEHERTIRIHIAAAFPQVDVAAAKDAAVRAEGTETHMLQACVQGMPCCSACIHVEFCWVSSTER